MSVSLVLDLDGNPWADASYFYVTYSLFRCIHSPPKLLNHSGFVFFFIFWSASPVVAWSTVAFVRLLKWWSLLQDTKISFVQLSLLVYYIRILYTCISFYPNRSEKQLVKETRSAQQQQQLKTNEQTKQRSREAPEWTLYVNFQKRQTLAQIQRRCIEKRNAYICVDWNTKRTNNLSAWL